MSSHVPARHNRPPGTAPHRCMLLTLALIAPLVCVLPAAGSPTASARPEVYFPPDVVGQFSALSTRPDAMGFYPGSSPNPSRCKHYQGMVRYQGADDTPYFVISRSGNIPPIPWLPDGISCGQLDGGDDDDPGNLLVIRMGSRDKHAERMRSNRIRRGMENADSPPEADDTLLIHITFDGSNGWPNYGHPGGMQIVGDVLAVPLETPYPHGGDLPDARILFIDVSTPSEPKLLSQFDPGVVGMKAGLVGLAPQPGGKYLLLISGGTNETVWFYETKATDDKGTPDDPSDDRYDLKAPNLDWQFLDTWTKAEDESELGASWPIEGGAHQSLTFIREGDINGDLYLAGARNTVTAQYFGDDYVDLYRVLRTGNQFKLQHVVSSHKNTHPNSDGSITLPETPLNDAPTTANFAAASTFYVSPTGELLFYATEHDNDGATEFLLFAGGSIKAGEWRHIEMVRDGSPLQNPTAIADGPYEVDEGSTVTVSGHGEPAISKAWIQLFANRNLSDRYVVFDYDDRFKDNFDDFKNLDGDILDTRLGFDDIASSWNWFAPYGCTIRANDDSFGDGDFPGENTRTLAGEGHVDSKIDLRDVCNDSQSSDDCSGNNGQMDDELTSVEFRADCDSYYSAPLVYAWDLDADMTFETSGAVAEFSADNLDGPSVVQIPFSVTHPTDGRMGITHAQVTVHNVAPQINSTILHDDLGQEIGTQVSFAIAGLDISLRSSFTDAGKPDTHTAMISWGDGSGDTSSSFELFIDSTGGTQGHVRQKHSYPTPGSYPIKLTLMDDDGGVTEFDTSIEVISPLDALKAIVDEINAMIATSTDPTFTAALISIRDALVGNKGGVAQNGAMDHYEADNLKASFIRLHSLLNAIDTAEPLIGHNLDYIRNIVGMAAKSTVLAVYNERLAATPTPNAGEFLRLQSMEAAIMLGNQLLAAKSFHAAIDAYHTALP